MEIKNSAKFFCNRECEYFPCHPNINAKAFNCLFCYCPLYLLGEKCGGNFEYIGKKTSRKNCSGCTLPHNPDSYNIIIAKLKENVFTKFDYTLPF